MRKLLALLGRLKPQPRRDDDAERLMRIYRETVAEMQDLRRAA